MMTVMTPSRVLSLALLLTLPSLGACRDPAELSSAVTAVLIVVGVDDDNTVEVDIGGASRRAQPARGDNLVSFSLPLPAGTHVGTVVVFEVEDDDGGEAERPSAVVAEDLGECPEEETEPVEDDGGEGDF